jgi:hypothetical protein
MMLDCIDGVKVLARMPGAATGAALLFLAACVADPTPIGPLSALDIRARLIERTIVATSDGGRTYFIRFERNGRALINDDTAVFGAWHVDERGLCLKAHEAAESCAPVYQLNVAHFRWGDTALGDLSVPVQERR